MGVNERYTQWKTLVPVLYDWLANHNLVWPSLSCRSLSPFSFLGFGLYFIFSLSMLYNQIIVKAKSFFSIPITLPRKLSVTFSGIVFGFRYVNEGCRMVEQEKDSQAP
jgi:ABC-type sugar transport system permease subunit